MDAQLIKEVAMQMHLRGGGAEDDWRGDSAQNSHGARAKWEP